MKKRVVIILSLIVFASIGFYKFAETRRRGTLGPTVVGGAIGDGKGAAIGATVGVTRRAVGSRRNDDDNRRRRRENDEDDNKRKRRRRRD